MGVIGLTIGVVGFIILLFSPGLGLVLLVFGALIYLAGSNARRRETEERRHRELLEAVQQRKGGSPIENIKNGPPL